MRCNAINLLRQAARAIDPRKDVGAYAFVLGEMAEHLEQVRDGTITWDDFADCYCLTASDRPAS